MFKKNPPPSETKAKNYNDNDNSNIKTFKTIHLMVVVADIVVF